MPARNAESHAIESVINAEYSFGVSPGRIWPEPNAMAGRCYHRRSVDEEPVRPRSVIEDG